MINGLDELDLMLACDEDYNDSLGAAEDTIEEMSNEEFEEYLKENSYYETLYSEISYVMEDGDIGVDPEIEDLLDDVVDEVTDSQSVIDNVIDVY